MFSQIFKIKHEMSNRYSMEKVKTNLDRSNFVNKPKHNPPLVKE